MIEYKSKPLFTDNLRAIGKLNYAKGDRPDVECIFCAVRDDDSRVQAFKIYQERDLFITPNLYPYNSGHIMVIPSRHVEQFTDLTIAERNRIFEVVIQSQSLLKAIFSPVGFNVGWNQGRTAGASIQHIHIHVVPRYEAELGYIDIIGGTKIILEPLSEVIRKIQERLHEFIQPPKV
ncbi:MAG: HIT domain-containing protein [Candidatus Heimdallarchaeota archaeon]|nr:HIT domain-containing protein [Candidatus Heimdallarchaeota archaeon]